MQDKNMLDRTKVRSNHKINMKAMQLQDLVTIQFAIQLPHLM